MDLDFEKGSMNSPKGHALVYFKQSHDANVILATYIVALPIKVDVSKYIPPMFASHIQGLDEKDLSGFSFPPVPEEFDNLDRLRHLAEARDDDVIVGGIGNFTDPMSMAQLVMELQQEYTRLWGNSIQSHQNLQDSQSVNELLYELMSDRDKLNELSKLVGKLRFASEGSDPRLVKETEEEISLLAKHFPTHYRIPDLIQTTEMSAAIASELAQLYLERCYKLQEEDYQRLQEVEEQIRRLEEIV